MSELSALIRCLRASGKKQAEIVATLHCSRSYVSEVLSGKKGADEAISKAELKAAEIEQLNERVIELSNALLVEKANNARLREAVECFVAYVESIDGCDDFIPPEVLGLYGKAFELAKQALKGEG